MSKANPVRLGGLLVLAAALAVVAVLSLGHLQAGTSLAGSPGAMAIDCDATQAGVQPDCSYGPGTTFKIQVHVTDPPAGGYFGFQAKVRWVDGVVNYLPNETDGASAEALWPLCGVPARTVNTPGEPSVLFGCVPFPAPAVGDTFTGAVLEFEFNCKSDFSGVSPPPGLNDNQSSLELVPRAGDNQLGTHFLDANLSAIDPTLGSATVTCEPQPQPPTPTETPTGGGPTCGTAGCTGLTGGDQSIEVGDSTVLTWTVTELDQTTPVEGVTCTFSVTSGSGTVDPTTATSDADGHVSTTFTAGSTPETVSVQADCGAYGTDVRDITVSPAALPGTGVGSSDNGLSTTIWSIAGALLAAAVVGVGFFGWRYARTRP